MAQRRGTNWTPQQGSTAANAYPTPDQIAEFLEANRKGGAEAIAQLLREKQAQAKEQKGHQNLKRLEEPGTVLPHGEIQPGDMEMTTTKKEQWELLREWGFEADEEKP